MARRIVVINPNSSRDVTTRMSEALDGLRFRGGPEILCVTLDEGPPGVETDRHIAQVAGLVREAVRSTTWDADAFVIACFSDPGLRATREATAVPVYGIGQCAYAAALARGERFGVISILPESVARHRRQVAALGLSDRLAGDVAIDMTVTDLADAGRTFERMRDAGHVLIRDHGADVAIMGCAGMARHRRPLERTLGVPVIEPTRAAVAIALDAVQKDGA